ncbi:MAG: class I SAM-dependent methyltransferase [Actinomycetota bacterium]
MTQSSVVLRTEDGFELPMDLDLWLSDPTAADGELLKRAVGPVLDVGCGPGRHVWALARNGVVALGVDASRSAVDIALSRGVPVLQRSIFDPLPGTGRWGSLLILDGSVGIGGDPVALLRRASELLRSGGRALVEVGPPGSDSRNFHARLESGAGCTTWFPWACLGVDAVPEVAQRAGMDWAEIWNTEGRWFARLTKL